MKRIIAIILLINLFVLNTVQVNAVEQKSEQKSQVSEDKCMAGGFYSDDSIKIDEQYGYFVEVDSRNEIKAVVEELSLTKDDYCVSEDVCGKTFIQMDLIDSNKKKVESVESIIEIEKNYNVNGCSTDAEIEGATRWYLKAMNVLEVENEASEKSVKVELLDSGVAYTSALESVHQVNLTSEESVLPIFADENGHGTALAGVICANSERGEVCGINPNVDLYSVDILDANLQAPISKVVEGIYWGIENGMDIINMSFGTTVNSEMLHTAIKAADSAGILMIAAAGNEPEKGVLYPAAYPEVIAVGATNQNGELLESCATGNQVEL